MVKKVKRRDFHFRTGEKRRRNIPHSLHGISVLPHSQERGTWERGAIRSCKKKKGEEGEEKADSSPSSYTSQEK